MIIVNLYGGLGNQLFQYACGKAVAERLGVELQLDISHLKEYGKATNFTVRDFELGVFSINEKTADIQEVRKYVPNLYKTSRYYHQLWRIKRLFNGRHLFIERTWQRDRYIENIEKVKDNTYLYGYFQSARYFADIEEKLRTTLVLKDRIDAENEALIQQMENENSVSIHIRRGDYENSRFSLPELDTYYLPAIKAIQTQIPQPKFYIFSNDAEWVKKNFNSLEIKNEIVSINSGSRSFMDMILMSRCKHNIIGNSSFSWWGAWLNQNPDKMIVVPKNWYKNGRETDLQLKEWIKI
ncbi:MAG TPA: alpha-1,2-fucosyltransferase [Salinivirgaceae bacterium]|nr:MAG: Glycosyl transferase family 11 [Bacteroidetes bacterium ADurb.Bin174]HPW66832.1 alpha-1,2-fucosyltransferase [Salinivirgaceae bacterium]